MFTIFLRRRKSVLKTVQNSKSSAATITNNWILCQLRSKSSASVVRAAVNPRDGGEQTTLQVLDEPGKPAQSKSYLWLMATFGSRPACVYHYRDNRSQTLPLELLNSTSKTLMVDGYEAYQKACDTYSIKRLGCMAHARRKFVEAQKLQKKTGKADQAISFIQKLYAIEKRIKDQPPDERYRIRQQEAVPIIEKLKAWKDKSLATVMRESTLGKALIYLHNQWDRLVGYVEDGHYPIDNNAAERAIRPFTIGRKNWLFSKSQAGAKASANLYSVIETAKANHLNIYDYLTLIFKGLPNAQSVEDIEKLLPWNVQLI
ncbi:IS66 family transposase [Sessilibacter sp. MAH2]